jgi:hypothetical protein
VINLTDGWITFFACVGFITCASVLIALAIQIVIVLCKDVARLYVWIMARYWAKKFDNTRGRVL